MSRDSASFKPCAVDGCDGNAHWRVRGVRGWCARHHARWVAHGTPTGGGTDKGARLRHFEEVVLSYRGDECLIWPFARDPFGYGKMRADGREVHVHRYGCEKVHGPPPSPQHEAAHTCGNGDLGCVNLCHVRWATDAENEADKIVHGRSNRGERCGSAKLTEEQVTAIRRAGSEVQGRKLAAEYGVSESTISKIRRGTRWAWLGQDEVRAAMEAA